MNLQTMTIIFVIIFLPIILISTYYIQMEVDTIRLQSSYDTKLIDATTDALSAFEINTANEDLSSVSDSLRSIIEASNNVFTTTLATNLGMSSATKSKILPYIPAVVYTLYDGYYIYAPTQTPKVVTDPDGVYVRVGDPGVKSIMGKTEEYAYDYNAVEAGTATSEGVSAGGVVDSNYGKILYYTSSTTTGSSVRCTTNPNNDSAYFSTKYILKSFVPYSMRYTGTNYDITINYTLDNFITVSGTIEEDGNDVFYTKSGYLIDYNKITFESTDSYAFNSTSIDNADSLIENDQVGTIVITDESGSQIRISKGESAESEYYTGDKISDNESAMKYYLKAYLFSKWFLDKFGNLVEKQAETSYNNDGITIKQNFEDLDTSVFYDFSLSNKKIFKNSSNNFDLKNFDSNFYEHKRKVIKNSIQYNLNLAMMVYNAGQGDEYYQMPVITEPEWDKLLSNVSILSFMQGLPCGMKTYSNYTIVTSKNNELMANEDEIYYVPIFTDEQTDGVKTSENVTGDDLNVAHKIDCKELSNEISKNGNVKFFQSFASRDIKYDKEWNSDLKKYVYDHVVNSCYYCIVNSNYESQSLSNQLEKAELIAIAKIRNNTYKSCAFSTNYGIWVDNVSKSVTGRIENVIKSRQVYEVEIVIKNAMKKSGDYFGTLDMCLGSETKYEVKTYSTTTDEEQTIRFSDCLSWGTFWGNQSIYLNHFMPQTIHEKNDRSQICIPGVDIVSITYKYK